VISISDSVTNDHSYFNPLFWPEEGIKATASRRIAQRVPFHHHCSTLKMKIKLDALLLVLLAVCLSACGDTAGGVHEAVLRPGQRITSTNRFGTVQITYISPRTRSYEWDKFHEVRKLWLRTDRWYGSLGLYDPSPSLLFEPKVRLVLEEGIKNFRTEEQIVAKLREANEYEDWTYNNTGLVVGFGRDPARGNQVNVDVFQYLINGKKPSFIPDSRPSQIRLESFDPLLTQNYNSSVGKKAQDEIPPLINDPFTPSIRSPVINNSTFQGQP
jgi:hypothetical protein